MLILKSQTGAHKYLLSFSGIYRVKSQRYEVTSFRKIKHFAVEFISRNEEFSKGSIVVS